MASSERCRGASAAAVPRSATRLTHSTRRLHRELSIHAHTPRNIETGGYLGVGSIVPRASEGFYARFFPAATTSTAPASVCRCPPLGLPPKDGSDSKPRNKKDDHQQLMGSDIFAG